MTAHEMNDSPENFARELFRTDPQMSIDSAARALDKARLPIGKEHLIRIRREVRLANGGSVTPVPPIVRRAAEKTTSSVSVDTTTNPGTATLKTVPAPTPAPIESTASKEERERFLYDWLEKELGAGKVPTVNEARQAVHDKFGLSLGTAQLTEIVRLAKEVAGVTIKRGPQKVTPAPLPTASLFTPPSATQSVEVFAANVAREMVRLGISKIEVTNGSFRVEMTHVISGAV